MFYLLVVLRDLRSLAKKHERFFTLWLLLLAFFLRNNVDSYASTHC